VADRVVGVNAYTTFTLLDGEREGHGWTEDAPAVLNVATGGGDVLVELELDDAATDRAPPHADRVRLSAADARALADELESYADRVED